VRWAYYTGSFDFFGWFASMGNGIIGMGELIIVTLLAGGMLETIRYNGGIDYIINALTKRVKNKRGAELSIAALVSIANLCTANNTIAIITTGPIARNIAHQVSPRPQKSCQHIRTLLVFHSGNHTYGAQMLLAADWQPSPYTYYGNL
jgi:Na+/H+ antiporter NhaC